MRKFTIYEHIKGLPSHIDTEVNEELAECIHEYSLHCDTEDEVEKYVNEINKAMPSDKYGREHNLYVYWHK